MRNFVPDVCQLFSRCILVAGLGVIFSLILMGFGGCASPVVHYTIESKIDDVWAEKPSQSISTRMEFKR